MNKISRVAINTFLTAIILFALMVGISNVVVVNADELTPQQKRNVFQSVTALRNAQQEYARKQRTWLPLQRVFKHSNCVNCHAIGTTTGSNRNQQTQVKRVVIPHPNDSPADCEGCHAVATEGLSDVLNIDWHTPRISMKLFANKPQNLCNAAKRRTSVTVREHLTRDPLILRAVVGGVISRRIVYGKNIDHRWNAAFSGGKQAWINAVDAWIDEGMPCPNDRFNVNRLLRRQ